MTNEEIFKKAIDKAKENGYEPINCDVTDMYENFSDYEYCVYSNIFNHDFAKAFWGNRRICDQCEHKYEKKLGCTCCNPPHCLYCGKGYFMAKWKYYIQIMVLKEEPLKYIKKFL